MSEDMDEHYPSCPILADEDPNSDVTPVCNCDEETAKIRADFKEARYQLERGN